MEADGIYKKVHGGGWAAAFGPADNEDAVAVAFVTVLEASGCRPGSAGRVGSLRYCCSSVLRSSAWLLVASPPVSAARGGSGL